MLYPQRFMYSQRAVLESKRKEILELNDELTKLKENLKIYEQNNLLKVVADFKDFVNMPQPQDGLVNPL